LKPNLRAEIMNLALPESLTYIVSIDPAAISGAG
jgi:hypothetical protein